MDISMDISIDIHGKFVDMDMNGKLTSTASLSAPDPAGEPSEFPHTPSWIEGRGRKHRCKKTLHKIF